MKRGTLLLGCLMLAASVSAVAQSAGKESWIGVWQGERDGLPSVTLTLADDNGELGGTVVLNVFGNDNGEARVVASEPHVLVHPRLDGNTFSFQARRIDHSAELMNFAVVLGQSGKAQIHCVNCGPVAPFVELLKAR